MRFIRTLVVAVAIVLAGLIVFALLPAPDATGRILAVRGKFGDVRELAASRNDRSSTRYLALRNDRGDVVSTAWIRRPTTLDPAYRVAIIYAGAKTGDAILRLIPEQNDRVLVAMQYPWVPRHSFVSKLRTPYDVRRAAYRTVAAGLLAVDYIERDERLATERIVIVGASLGSVFATLHGAIDTRVPEVVLIHGGAGLPAMLDAALYKQEPPWWRHVLVRLARIPIDTFDPTHYVGRISPRRLVVIAARNDRQFPPDAVLAFFANARQPKQLLWTNTVHVGARNRQVVDAVLAQLDAYLKR